MDQQTSHVVGQPNDYSSSVQRFGLARLRARHREAARLLACGMSEAFVKGKLGWSDSRFSIITRSPLFRAEVERLMALRDGTVSDIREVLLEHAADAVDVLVENMHIATDAKERRVSACEVLDRSGVTGGKGGGLQININTNPDPVDLSKYRTKPHIVEVEPMWEIEAEGK